MHDLQALLWQRAGPMPERSRGMQRLQAEQQIDLVQDLQAELRRRPQCGIGQGHHYDCPPVQIQVSTSRCPI